MAGRIPLIVGFGMVVFSVSLVVYWMLTGSLFGIGQSEPETPAATQTTTAAPNPLAQPAYPNPTPTATTQPPAQTVTAANVPEKKTPPPVPTPPEVLWSHLNERIRLLEETRQTLIKSLVERMPEEAKMAPMPSAATMSGESQAHLTALTTPNAPATPSTHAQQPQLTTWQEVTQQMIVLEQTRQQLIHALAKQLEEAGPNLPPIQPLQFEEPRLPPSSEPTRPVASDTLSLLSTPDEINAELLTHYQLRPADTNQLLSSRVTSIGYVFVLSDLVFETDKAELYDGNLYMLERLAQIMQAHPEQTILIEGHTDDRGSSQYNLQLSQRRAQAVYQALREHGVAETRFKVRGYGELLPIADNNSEAGRLKNRRVEITLLSERGLPLVE